MRLRTALRLRLKSWRARRLLEDARVFDALARENREDADKLLREIYAEAGGLVRI